MTKVKICGITNLEDALLSVRFGADALGFNFYERSPRYILPEKTKEICLELPPEILKVGVFVNESLDKIVEIAQTVPLDAVQLHGDETPNFVRQLKEKFSGEVIKALRVSENFQPEDVLHFNADAILLDAYSKQEYGGTGETFDWKIAFKVSQIAPKLYLAGGLDSKNVALAIKRVQPFAVDSCSLLEKEKGKKDKQKIFKYIAVVKEHKNFEIKDIYDLLFLIELRPAMYLGSHSISNLIMFLRGIEFGLNEIGSKDFSFDWRQFKPKISPHYEHGFQAWISKKLLNRDTYPYDWSYIILQQTDNNEEKALDLFFALLEEFKLEKENLKSE